MLTEAHAERCHLATVFTRLSARAHGSCTGFAGRSIQEVRRDVTERDEMNVR